MTHTSLFYIRYAFIIIIITTLLACTSPLGEPVNYKLSDNYYYHEDKKQVLYCEGGYWLEIGASRMEVDINTFEVLSQNFAKDKSNIFYQNSLISDERIDKASFYVKDGGRYNDIGICMDKDNVYEIDSYGKVTKILKNVDPETYTVIEVEWAKDKNNYYLNDVAVAVDYPSFRVINDSFCRDTTKVYFYSERRFKAFNADMATLKEFAYKYMVDKNYVYCYLEYKYDSPIDEKGKLLVDSLLKIPYKNASSILELSSSYIKIDNAIYCQGYKMNTIDIDSYKIVDQYHIKDKNNVYCLGNLIQGADAATFDSDIKTMWHKDKNRYYRYGKVIEVDTLSHY